MTPTEHKRRQRESILEMYRRNYAKPFWEAYRDGDSKEMTEYMVRGYCFRLGVFMAAPHSHYGKAFNQIDIDLENEIKTEK